MTDWVAFTESKFGIRLKKVGRTEWAGPCPWCGGRDRFHLWERGNYFCREGAGHCGRSGWLDELDGAKQLSREELLELRVAALERKQAEHDRRLSALEKMHECEDHLLYHRALTHQGAGADYWFGEGMTVETINRYKLGYCSNCPTAPGQASYTIPVMALGKLWQIRHRLAAPNGTGKYRPHVAGLPSMLFDYDSIQTDDTSRALILEGEKKSMVVGQETGIPRVATMGMQNFKREWAAKLAKFRQVLVAFDPDATEKAAQVAALFGERGRVVELPVKADDFFTRYGGTQEDFMAHLRAARPA